MSDASAGKRRRPDVETIPSATPRPAAEAMANERAEADEPAATAEPVTEATPDAPTAEPVAELTPDESTAEPATPEAATTAPSDPAAADAPTVGETLARADSYFRAFRALAAQFPRHRIDEPLTREWTRKQMLAHVAAWHDRTTERLIAFIKTGAEQPLGEGIDGFNARVARAAVGRTSGEVLGSLDSSFNRLRRTIAQLTDEQLREHDAWASAVVAGNTYEHYDEHADDLRLPT